MVSPKSSDTGAPTSAQRILERAIEVIDAGGEVAIRTNIIANECGVTAPILYRAFGSREGLIIAAQAERYRRSKAIMVTALVSYIEQANDRDELKSNIRESLDLIFAPHRSPNRELRAEVIGSAVSRPALRDAIVTIDQEFATEIATAYQRAVDEGWVRPGLDVHTTAQWAQAVVNASILVEFSGDAAAAVKWTELSRNAIMNAIFGES